MNTTVLIVGAGPVGLTLACELTRYRVSVRIVDKAPQRTDKSKAIVIWSRTLELPDRGDTGAAPFIEAGFKVDGVDIVTADRRVVGHWPPSMSLAAGCSTSTRARYGASQGAAILLGGHHSGSTEKLDVPSTSASSARRYRWPSAVRSRPRRTKPWGSGAVPSMRRTMSATTFAAC